MVTILKTETYGYGSWHSLKILCSLYPIVTWYSFNKFHIKYGFDEAKYQRPGPSSFRQEIFISFTYWGLVKKIDLSVKKGEVQP